MGNGCRMVKIPYISQMGSRPRKGHKNKRDQLLSHQTFTSWRSFIRDSILDSLKNMILAKQPGSSGSALQCRRNSSCVGSHGIRWVGEVPRALSSWRGPINIKNILNFCSDQISLFSNNPRAYLNFPISLLEPMTSCVRRKCTLAYISLTW